MSQTATRRTTREKKPARQYWYDEPDYSNLVAVKGQEQKDKSGGAQDANAVAKMLVRFIQSANHRSKEAMEPTLPEPPVSAQERLPPSEVGFGVPARCQGPRSGREPSDGKLGSRVPLIDNSNGEGKIGKRGGKGGGLKEPKGGYSITATLEPDLSYHTAINEHVKNAYPNINSLSPDMLRELTIPTEILSKPAVSKPQKEVKKGGVRGGKGEENKPFKRQSYHVAIAYHIHLKQVKTTRTVEYVDPTFPARRLKEEESKKM